MIYWLVFLTVWSSMWPVNGYYGTRPFCRQVCGCYYSTPITVWNRNLLDGNSLYCAFMCNCFAKIENPSPASSQELDYSEDQDAVYETVSADFRAGLKGFKFSEYCHGGWDRLPKVCKKRKSEGKCDPSSEFDKRICAYSCFCAPPPPPPCESKEDIKYVESQRMWYLPVPGEWQPMQMCPWSQYVRAVQVQAYKLDTATVISGFKFYCGYLEMTDQEVLQHNVVLNSFEELEGLSVDEAVSCSPINNHNSIMNAILLYRSKFETIQYLTISCTNRERLSSDHTIEIKPGFSDVSYSTDAWILCEFKFICGVAVKKDSGFFLNYVTGLRAACKCHPKLGFKDP